MLWGAIRSEGSRVLVRCDEKMNSEAYQRILAQNLNNIYHTRYIFQQDGAPAIHLLLLNHFWLKNQLEC